MFSPLVPGQMLRVPVVNANGTLAASNAPMPAAFAPQGIPLSAQAAPLGSNPAIGVGSSSIAPQGVPNGASAGSTPLQSPSIPPLESTFKAPSAAPAASVAPAANIRTVKEETALPRVAIGSTLMLDGDSLGEEKGTVRLRIGTMSLPVDVVEWTVAAVKIELPKMELDRPVKAILEVLRADGGLASKSEIELTPAATRLALGN
jgi:hypothetical protein